MAAPTFQPDTPAAPTAAVVPQVARGARLAALDAWRGLTVLLMLLVNNVALDWRTPKELMHAPWGGGATLADLVFPWFLFCAGTALPFSLASARRAGVRGWALVRKLLTRTVLLYLVGVVLVSAVAHRLTFGLGVLQLIALASLLGAAGAQLRVGARMVLAAALLVGYAAVLLLTPVPGVGAGVLEETRNAVQYLNQTFLAPLGVRGLLSVLPTGALVLLGSVAGEWARRTDGVPRLLALGAALSALGFAWGAFMPINKPLWTPPYILLGAGLGTLGLLACLLVERGGRGRSLTPLVAAGRNALLAYVAPILVKTWVLQGWQVRWTGRDASMQDALLGLARGHLGLWWGGWLYTLGYVGAVWVGLWWLYRRGVTWKL
ncbi:heparan-alpha-glucosaminide N-acetyltransferase domain-containing protein [Deinococcus maricopensis]|uniref:Heparan-alpha-glucosaminide N-acetyltransferase catalytic domain-containing protein n=1 Tax=Deinococcus maricopensis (strain DSM 21211 / LMG 22137 / NRRL B-23946 / LB-34) TaxID=709986 RepID=E8U6N6_DEIML|nr:heparan-alpha-glucosaminide N-acetyltransferase domain-containing protein [Deinococcus maricopensis]ADV66725.1 hypothetical protein Deima_1072 [Deinococcus maricopensis DSM 21211]